MSKLRRDVVLASLVTLVFVPMFACEAPVNKNSAQVGPMPVPASELESCSNAGQCLDTLRCVDNLCQRQIRSRLGDFYAASARLAIVVGDTAQAASEFNLAVVQYESEEIDLPLDILCGQGQALALARSDIKLGEAAGRVLHRCILAAPANSTLAKKSMEAMVSLREVGLDPSVISRDEIADLYLSGPGEIAAPPKLTIAFRDDGKASKKRGFATLLTELQSGPSTSAMKNCLSGDSVSGGSSVEVGLPFAYRYFMDEDDEARDRFELSLESVDGTTSAAETCVRAASQVVIDGLKKKVRDHGRWKSTITVTLSAQ